MLQQEIPIGFPIKFSFRTALSPTGEYLFYCAVLDETACTGNCLWDAGLNICTQPTSLVDLEKSSLEKKTAKQSGDFQEQANTIDMAAVDPVPNGCAYVCQTGDPWNDPPRCGVSVFRSTLPEIDPVFVPAITLNLVIE